MAQTKSKFQEMTLREDMVAPGDLDKDLLYRAMQNKLNIQQEEIKRR